MIVLHGSWLPESGGAPARFALWGETAQLGTTKPRPRGRPRKGAGVGAHPHPFAATAEALAAASPISSLGAKTQALAIIVRLPTVAGEPVPSRPFLRESAAKGQPSLSSWAIPARRLCATRSRRSRNPRASNGAGSCWRLC